MATVEAVARENGSVFAALGPSGVAVFPADEEFTPLWKRTGRRARLHDFRRRRAMPTSFWPGLNGKAGIGR